MFRNPRFKDKDRDSRDRDDRGDRRREGGPFPRYRLSPKFKITNDAELEYKNFPLLQKFINDRGKIIPRRITGVSSKQQRLLTTAIKRARFLALITSGGVKR